MTKKENAPRSGSPKRRIPSYIILCLFSAFNVCFFLPMDIYMANANDIETPIRPLAAYLGLVTLGIFAAAFLTCLLIKGRVNRIFRAILFGISMAFYIQGNFLALNMGMLNGERYEVPAWKAALNIVIWLAVLAAPFVILQKLPDKFDELLPRISEAVLLIQLIALGASAYINIPKYSMEKLDAILTGDAVPYCSAIDLDLYSTNKNLLIIIADEYDSFCFDNAIEEDPGSISEFDGFTYYANTIGKHNMTMPAVAHITTGDPDAAAYRDQTFYRNVSENFKANFYCDTTVPLASVTSKYCGNIGYTKITLGDTRKYSKNLFKLVFFRCMPEVLKPLFWFDGENIGEGLDALLEERLKAEVGAGLYDFDNLDFFDNMPRDLKTTDEDVFKFIYLLGLHTPRSVTKNLERAPDSSVSPDDAAVAVNKIVNEYLKVLKENDVYDNSEIIFMADHGLSEHAGKRFPLLLYKPANQSGTGITISNAPISYDDMFPTLVKLSGGEPTARTIFDIGEDEERVRYFGMDNKEFYGHVKNSE